MYFYNKISYLFLRSKKVKSLEYAKDYDIISKTYDNLWIRKMGKYTREMLSKIDFNKDYSLLDLACGTGYIIEEALKKEKPSGIVGIDNSKGMLNIAKKRFKTGNVKFILGDILEEIKKLPDDSFDIITCGWALAYVNKKDLIREIHRLLKKNGQVGIIVNRKKTIKIIEDAFMKLMEMYPNKVKIINDIRFKLPKDCNHIRKLLENNHLSWSDGWDKEQTFTFKNIPSDSVPSFFREFSAPVKLYHDLTRDELAFLMANDSDEFNKWDAAQTLFFDEIKQFVQNLQTDTEPVVDPGLISAFKCALKDKNTNMLFLSRNTI